MTWNVWQYHSTNLWNPINLLKATEETDRMVLRANSEALPWAPVPEGPAGEKLRAESIKSDIIFD